MKNLNKTLLNEYSSANVERKIEIEEIILINNRGLIESFLRKKIFLTKIISKLDT